MLGEFPAGSPMLRQQALADEGSKKREDETEMGPPVFLWPDAGLAERDPQTYLRRRLELIERQGYRYALLWRAKNDPTSCRAVWEATQQEQVKKHLLCLP